MQTVGTNSGDDTGLGLANDLLWGVQEIADAINRSPRQCFRMLENNRLPAKKVGGRWCSSRAALRKFFEHQLGGA